MRRRENDLGRDPMAGLLLRLAIPTMLAQFINVLYSIVDRIFIGHIAGVGSLALAGVRVCGPIVTLLSSFSMLVGLGGTPLMAMKLGAGQREEAADLLSNCSRLLLGLAMGLSCLFVWAGDASGPSCAKKWWCWGWPPSSPTPWTA